MEVQRRFWHVFIVLLVVGWAGIGLAITGHPTAGLTIAAIQFTLAAFFLAVYILKLRHQPQ